MPELDSDVMTTEEAIEREYTYEPLEEPDKSIRLLKILSTTPRITGAFKVVSIGDSPVFSALSYVWGDPNITEPVAIEGGAINITVNLAGAIREVYRLWSEAEKSLRAPGEEQWLWADALCINQKDLEEKNHQVPLMEKIYPKAHLVFAWICGEENKSVCRAVYAYHDILHEIGRLPGYSFIQHRAQNSSEQVASKEEVLAEVGDELFGAITDLTWLRKHYDVQNDSGESVKTLSDAKRLFEAPYWKRLWILQELVLATGAILLCGSTRISWVEVCCVELWIKVFQMKHPSVDKPHCVPIGEWTCVTEFGAADAYTRICTLKACTNIEDRTRGYEIISTTDSLNEAARKELFEAAICKFIMGERGLHYEATNAKDYVYGFGGVTGIRMPTDYTSGTTVAQVYQEYVVQWLNALVLGEAVEGEPCYKLKCDLWFLTYAGIGFLWTPIPGLPSWVPNLKGVADSNINWEDERSSPPFLRHRGDLTDNDVFPQGTQRATWLDSSLYCTAVVVEQSISIGPTIHAYKNPDTHSFEEDEWLLWIYDILTCRRERIFDVVFALYSLDDHLQSLDWEQAVLLLLVDLEYACVKRRAMFHWLFYIKLGLLPSARSIAHLDEVGRRVMGLMRNWDDPRNGEEVEQQKIKASVVIPVYKQALRGLHGFRLALTTSGLFGVFPPLTEDGDVVCALKGYTLPVVLRKDGDGYQLVGACRIPSLKKTEIGDMIRDGRARVEHIRIH